MKAAEFEYFRPRTVDEVLGLLAERGEDAKLIAGGQSLMPAMNMRLAQPAVLVDLNHVEGLDDIALAGERLRIGALARHAALGRSDLVARHAPLLAEAAPHIAHEAIRNRGTLGGSLATADPASEWPACCLALGARLHLCSRRGERTVAADEFFQGVYQTAMEPDELLLAIDVPIVGKDERSGFAELARRKGDYALAGLAAYGQVRGRGSQGQGEARFHDLRLAFFAVSDRPVLARRAAAALEGQPLTPDTLREAQRALDDDVQPMADLYTSSATKAHLARVLLARVLTPLYEEARDEHP